MSIQTAVLSHEYDVATDGIASTVRKVFGKPRVVTKEELDDLRKKYSIAAERFNAATVDFHKRFGKHAPHVDVG